MVGLFCSTSHLFSLIFLSFFFISLQPTHFIYILSLAYFHLLFLISIYLISFISTKYGIKKIIKVERMLHCILNIKVNLLMIRPHSYLSFGYINDYMTIVWEDN